MSLSKAQKATKKKHEKSKEQQRKLFAPKQKYWSSDEIDKTEALYRIVIGGRSTGKTYCILKKCLENYILKGEPCAYIRRYAEELTPKNLAALFNPHKELLLKLTKGKYNSFFYRAREFHLAFIDDTGKIIDKDPNAFCFTVAINTSLTEKGQDRGAISTIVFDEFLTRDLYLKNEFILFQNVLSSLIRDRENVVIYMLGNTVNMFSPYWEELGITNITKMPQGSINVYKYGDSGLTVAVEYCADFNSKKEVSKFFAFNNPQLKMINEGSWELGLYPKCPYSLHDDDIKFKFYLKFQDDLIQGNIVQRENDYFIFFHRITRDINLKSNDIVLCDYVAASRYWTNDARDCPTKVHEIIWQLTQRRKLFFSTNEVGEVVRNYFLRQNKFDIK